MKIQIKCEKTDSEHEAILWLSNDENENDYYFDLVLDGVQVTLPLNEMLSALIAFDSSRSRRLADQEKMHNAGL